MSNLKFGFIPIASSINNTNIETIAADYWITLHQLGGEQIDESRIGDRIPVVYFILTGGTEQKTISLLEKRKIYFNNEPVILLAHPSNNSLPASLEILAYLQQQNIKGRIIYLDDNLNKGYEDEIEKTIKHLTIYQQLNSFKIGLIGDPSEWLVASSPESETIKKSWGPTIHNISIDELKNEIENVDDVEIENDNFSLTKKAKEIKEPSKKEIKHVVKVYNGLKKLIERNNLDAVSLRCFDLVLDLKTSGCFALSKLNDNGIIAGCEGDLVSTIGMVWANLMTDQAVWMANPARIDEQNNSLVLAHCTVPVSLIQDYKLRSHFESGLGVAIQGEFSKGKVTLFRIGGKDLKKLWITNGEIIESGNDENLCRTQINVKLHGSVKVNELLSNPLGNHILLIRGNYTKELLSWWENFIQ